MKPAIDRVRWRAICRWIERRAELGEPIEFGQSKYGCPELDIDAQWVLDESKKNEPS